MSNITGYAGDDGGRTGKLVFRNIKTGKLVDITSYEELIDISESGYVWVTERAAVMYDLLRHDSLVFITRYDGFDWRQIPNEVVNTTKWDEGLTGPASDQQACQWILEYARKVSIENLPKARYILNPSESTQCIKTYIGVHAALNTQRDKVMGDYIILRRCSWNNRELPEGYPYPQWILDYREKEKKIFSDVYSVAESVRKFLNSPTPFLKSILDNDERFYGLLIPMMSVAESHKGLRSSAFKHFINLTAINNGGYGSVWSADVKHNMQPAWIRNTFGEEMSKTPVASGKKDKAGEVRQSFKRQEYRPEHRHAFWNEFNPTMQTLLYAVMDTLNS